MENQFKKPDVELRDKFFKNRYTSFKTDGTHQTEFDGATFNALYEAIKTNLINNKSVRKYAQAIHNIYAKKLTIPPVRVVKRTEVEGAYYTHNFCLNSPNNDTIVYGDDIGLSGPTDVFMAMMHETKHAEQFYNIHKYLNYGVVPNAQENKLALMYEYFWCAPFTYCDKLSYRSGFYEIDAYTFELTEILKLHKYGENFSGMGYYENIIDKSFKLLYHFKYNKEGLNNPEIHKVYRAIKKDMYECLQGNYGKHMQKLVTDVINSGFDLDKAFENVINKLNFIYDQTVLLAYEMRKLGYKCKFEKNGNLIYHNRHVTAINPKHFSAGLKDTIMLVSSFADDEFYFAPLKRNPERKLEYIIENGK